MLERKKYEEVMLTKTLNRQNKTCFGQVLRLRYRTVPSSEESQALKMSWSDKTLCED